VPDTELLYATLYCAFEARVRNITPEGGCSRSLHFTNRWWSARTTWHTHVAGGRRRDRGSQSRRHVVHGRRRLAARYGAVHGEIDWRDLR
jgi:hypothetical protein